MKSKFKHTFLLVLLCLSQFCGLVGLTPQKAVQAIDQQETTILDTADVKVAVKATQNAADTDWVVVYTKHDQQQKRRLRLAVSADEAGQVQLPVKHGPPLESKAYATKNWIQEENFTTASTGQVTLKTASALTQIFIQVQLDGEAEEPADEIQLDLLHPKEAGPHEVSLAHQPEQAQEASAASRADVPSSDPDRVTAPSAAAAENVPEAPVAPINLLPVGQLLKTAAGSPQVTDPFTYRTDDGTYPAHGTAQYGNEVTDQSDKIRNYNYAANNAEPYSSVDNILNFGGFDGGYHGYTDSDGHQAAYTKKTVTPTADENIFKVQLDMIGQQLPKNQPVDVALVLDYSASMAYAAGNTTRWGQLKDAVRDFSASVLTPENAQNGNVQIGLVNFNSFTSGNTHYPTARIGSYDNVDLSDEKWRGFTADPTDVAGHELMNWTNPQGGTATFMGIDAGLALLTDARYKGRANVAKVLVVITDGQPTFSPRPTYYRSENDAGTDVKAWQASEEPYFYRFTVNNTSAFSGNGADITAAIDQGTIAHAQKRYGASQYQGIKSYSIGYNIDAASNNVLKAVGPHGQYQASDPSGLIDAFKQISDQFSATISHAQLRDPLGTAVSYVPNSLEKRGLHLAGDELIVSGPQTSDLPDFARAADAKFTGDQLHVDHLTLGADATGRQGLRLTYQVTLAEAYRDGKFHPTNGATYITENLGMSGNLHFAVPSVRFGQRLSFPVKKVWQNDQDHRHLRQPVVMKLEKKLGENGTWQAAGRQLTIQPGDTDGGRFDDLPVVENGQRLTYRVVEATQTGDTFVPGYQRPTYSPTGGVLNDPQKGVTVTNRLKTIPYTFVKTTVSGKPLANVQFELHDPAGNVIAAAVSNAQGQVTFSALALGAYTVHETTPKGFQAVAPFDLIVKDNGPDALSVSSGLNGDRLKNEINPFRFSLEKVDQLTGNGLKGAKFELSGHGTTKTVTTGDGGEVDFEDALLPGTYTLTEIAAPSGYVTLKGTFTFTISETGTLENVDYTGDDLHEDDWSLTATLNGSGDENRLHLKVANRPDTGHLPLTGGMGPMAWLLIGSFLLASAVLAWRKYHVQRRRDGAWP